MPLELPDDAEIRYPTSDDPDWRIGWYDAFLNRRAELRDAKHSGSCFMLVGNKPGRRVSPRDMSYQEIDELARWWATQSTERAIIEWRMASERRKWRKAALRQEAEHR